MQLTATSSGDADDEGRGPPLPTFLVSPWGRSLRNAVTIETSIPLENVRQAAPQVPPARRYVQRTTASAAREGC